MSKSDDHSRGDRGQPSSDRSGAAGRHAGTHEVRREVLRNPVGPQVENESFAAQLAPAETGPGGYAMESTPAAADKTLHERLRGLSNDELARLPVLETGARLEQGGIYIDLNHLDAGPFKALGGHDATVANRYVAKRDTDYQLWNRLAGQDAEPEIERPDEA
jgi:hypothetical protein